MLIKEVEKLAERAKRDKSKATGKTVIEAYVRYAD